MTEDAFFNAATHSSPLSKGVVFADRVLAVSKNGTAMIFPGFPGSSLTRNGTGAMP